jgi:multiple sugar transport system substrate-binding protein
MLGPFYDDHPNHLTALSQAEYMRAWYAWPGENNLKIIDVIKDHLQTIVDRSTSPEDALRTMTVEVQALMP